MTKIVQYKVRYGKDGKGHSAWLVRDFFDDNERIVASYRSMPFWPYLETGKWRAKAKAWYLNHFNGNFGE